MSTIQRTSAPAPAGLPAEHERWRSALYAALRGSAEPAIVLPGATISAASLWVASRHWVDFLRAQGLVAGDRVVLNRAPSAGFLAFFIAAMWEGLSVAVVGPWSASARSMEFFDARLGLGYDGLDADDAGCPLVPEDWSVREARMNSTPDVRLFMRTCGTSGDPTWAALSDRNIWSVLDSHMPRLVSRSDVVLSVLPWLHSFGLIIDLLPALLGAGIIVRDPSGGRDVRGMLSAAAAYGVTWCSMVPLQTQRLAASAEGLEFLRGLRGGVIGGASTSRQLAESIAGTGLFVGYGQTEASPGVTLGTPGCWVPGAIGAAVGCEIRLEKNGRLRVRGPNVCMGTWADGGLTRLASDRWLDTGDLVEERGGELIFMGRADNNFKLANGRMVDASAIEAALREREPRIVDCAVVSADGFGIRVFAVMDHPGRVLSDACVHSALGAMAERLEGVVTLTDSVEIRTPKGALDRLALVRAAREQMEQGR